MTKKNKTYDAGSKVYEFVEVEIDKECGIIMGMKQEYREEVMENVLKRIERTQLFTPVK